MSGLEDKGGSGQGEMGDKGIEGGSRRGGGEEWSRDEGEGGVSGNMHQRDGQQSSPPHIPCTESAHCHKN